MKSKFLIFLIGILFFNCSSDKGSEQLKTTTYEIEHFNFIIAPDLSNRTNNDIRSKPIKDEIIISKILDNIYPKILGHKRSENQKDIFRFSFINQGLINQYQINTSSLEIDFSKFTSQLDRINYIKDRSNNKLSKDIKNFKSEFDKIYLEAKKNNFGADIWSYLNYLDNSLINLTLDQTRTYDSTLIFTNRYRNILILLTDGYIEAGLYGEEGCLTTNQCYYLSSKRIQSFRNDYLKSGYSDLKKFFIEKKYGIIPVNNSILNNLEILVLEINDRSLDIAGNARIFPTDYDIIELFWSDWLTKSGVKNFKIKKIFSSETDAEKEIFSFVGI